ncbi:PREDICTED: ras-GEF domain-containing family member 1B-A-like, partial [Priapulus caudatus]|uniref:Ras-GEF domain-containing family member 1B-A-like n=1 Tax=Priapulus caudatus TaxID=37621 RepID=A0ABM1EUJ2_PRICU
TLIYQDGLLMSGSLEALIQHLVPTTTYYPDRAYIFAFLLSSRLYVRPHALMRDVCQVCSSQQNLSNALKRDSLSLGKFGLNMVRLLRLSEVRVRVRWTRDHLSSTEAFPYDFRDERVMKQLKEIIHRLCVADCSLRPSLMQILNALLDCLTDLDKYEVRMLKTSEVAQRLVDTDSLQTDVHEMCESPAVLAEQLTHIELERLRHLGPEEFVQAFAEDSKCAEITEMKKTKNLEYYAKWFNRLSYLVATDICLNVKKKQRAKIIEYFIDVAKECFNLGNFNSLMAIVAGMNMAPVSRLKKTWSKVDTSKFDILEHQMDPASNFNSYRATLQAAMWRSEGGHNDREKIIIPFFSLLLKDIYYLNEGCANKLPNGHVNFEKFWQLAKQIGEVMNWKRIECPFQKRPEIIDYLITTPVLSENALALASFECEPPETNYGKGQYKQLKLELR